MLDYLMYLKEKKTKKCKNKMSPWVFFFLLVHLFSLKERLKK